MATGVSRRSFLRQASLLGGSVVIGPALGACGAPPQAAAPAATTAPPTGIPPTAQPAPTAAPPPATIAATTTAATAFPAGFIWGAATSAYQIEGAVAEDGRGPSIWDRFAHTPGKIADGGNADVACDHYHRLEQDLDLMQRLGLRSYRFSIAWPRIFPTGGGAVNQPGLDFYKRLVEGLRARQIEPLATLYHWDLPQPLEDAGGWRNRDTAQRFADYAGALFDALGDQVTSWITINEPWAIAYLGHFLGIHAPGLRDFGQALTAAHHTLLAHGLAVQAFRARSTAGRIGITLNLSPVYAASDAPADRTAAERMDGWFNRWFLDALYRGAYPQDMRDYYAQQFGATLTAEQPDDLKIISAPGDVLGINYYNPQRVAGGSGGPLPQIAWLPARGATTESGWEINPGALYDLLTRVRRDYGAMPLVITENGAAVRDEPKDGAIDDPQRVAYLHSHLAALARAIEAGVPVAGYYVWSLMDNFEWDNGYRLRYGITHVDFKSQERTPRRSAGWYGDVIARNGLAEPADDVRALVERYLETLAAPARP